MIPFFYIRLFCVVLLYFCAKLSAAQINLLPTIGLSTLPQDQDSICQFTPYLGEFDTSGFVIGDTIADFTLYTLQDSMVNMHQVIMSGKPTLLISGSLTCPVFRNKIQDINTMASVYTGLVNIFVIFTMEAHPITPSPYSGTIWVTNQNQNEQILFPQPTTYGERKDLLDTLMSRYTLNVPVLLDGPCNEWLSAFGPAPNNAYLIDSQGIVYEKQGWFHKLPDDMYCEVDSLLGIQSGYCNTSNNQGSFSFQYLNDTIAYGLPGDVLAVEARLTNISSTDNCELTVIRWQVNAPANWSTALCIDVCLPPHIDTTNVVIPPASYKDFTFYFYTDPLLDGLASAQIGFKNDQINQNRFFRMFYGQTSKATSTSFVEHSDPIHIYPNPSSSYIRLKTDISEKPYSLYLYDIYGRMVTQESINEPNYTLDVSTLQTGNYILKVVSENTQVYTKKITVQ